MIVRYRERLWPAWWIWVVALGISAAGILVLAPINLAAGFIAAAVLFALLSVFFLSTTALIEVDDQTLNVGRARIERIYVTAAEGFRAEEAFQERGPRLNGLAYLCIRGWVSPVVKITINDPDDPTPYWLASTRHPEKLVAALTTDPS